MLRRVARSFTFGGDGMGWLYAGFALCALGPIVNLALAAVGFALIVVYAVVFF